jgi:hypothetical protein
MSMSNPANDPYAERPTETFQAGVYRSDEATPAAQFFEPAQAAQISADPDELTPEALWRLRARLVRKYHSQSR